MENPEVLFFSGIKTPFFVIIKMRGAVKTGGGWGFVIGDDWLMGEFTNGVV